MGDYKNFKEFHTTKSKKDKDPVGEKDKTEISEDAFAIGQMLELIFNAWVNK